MKHIFSFSSLDKQDGRTWIWAEEVPEVRVRIYWMHGLDKRCKAETVTQRETKNKERQIVQRDQRDSILISDKGICFKITASQKGFEG